MTQLKLKLQLITPLLMFGAFNSGNEAQPEIRASSIRGGLRYWLRAVYGAAYGSDITGLHEAESRIFGSTSRGSAVMVRVQHSLTGTHKKEYVVLPEKVDSNGRKVDHKFAGFKESDTNSKQSFCLTFVSHPLRRDVFNAAFGSALFLAFTLGGFGKRARRGGGALQIVEIKGDNLPSILRLLNPQNGTTLATELENRFSEVQQAMDLHDEEDKISSKRPYAATDIPAYPIFASDHCRVFVGKQGESDYLDALKQMWELTGKPPGSFHRQVSIDRSNNQITTRKEDRKTGEVTYQSIPDEWAWGYTLNDGQINKLDRVLGNRIGGRSKRRASALYMRVYQCNDGKYYPIVTIFRGGRSDEKWDRVQKVIDLFDKHSDFTRVYGTGADWTWASLTA